MKIPMSYLRKIKLKMPFLVTANLCELEVI
jgi:hypothetical protein